jgi:hypothetical protein
VKATGIMHNMTARQRRKVAKGNRVKIVKPKIAVDGNGENIGLGYILMEKPRMIPEVPMEAQRLKRNERVKMRTTRLRIIERSIMRVGNHHLKIRFRMCNSRLHVQASIRVLRHWKNSNEPTTHLAFMMIPIRIGRMSAPFAAMSFATQSRLRASTNIVVDVSVLRFIIPTNAHFADALYLNGSMLMLRVVQNLRFRNAELQNISATLLNLPREQNPSTMRGRVEAPYH